MKKSNFHTIMVCHNHNDVIEQFQEINTPCIVLVGDDKYKTKNEGFDIIFGKKNKSYTKRQLTSAIILALFLHIVFLLFDIDIIIEITLWFLYWYIVFEESDTKIF